MVGNSYMSYNGSVGSAALERVKLPAKTRCNGNKCNGKMKCISFFSEKQKLELKKWIADPNKAKSFDPQTSRVIVCVICTPGPKFEFYCQGCDTVKDRNKFSKAQVRNPDNAYCWECMEKRANMEPGGNDSDYSNNSGSSGGGSYGEDSDDATTTCGSTMAGLSLTGSGGGTSSLGYQTSNTGGVPLQPGSSSGFRSYAATGQHGGDGRTPSISCTSSGGGAAVPSGVNGPRRVVTPPHLRVKQTSSFTSGSRSTNNSTYDGSTTSNSNFAKIPAASHKITYGIVQKQKDEEANARAAAAKSKGSKQSAQEEDDDDVRAASDSDSD
ncbi:hypothetical protein LTR78_005130 [Recurvomyces mirabilis]|uniref:Stc1 domain-containing protein n=1 Tax=Recurvomyces mirabilis TaxID=574656 RepID=A0AAE1C241_9PEZI|nr:hypothetical protein LTR78_005130 [Recurvomyces mirabilis]KAK5158256.1 hypothetical protein LTS14_003274 [Recurvomyces mirabilis]